MKFPNHDLIFLKFLTNMIFIEFGMQLGKKNDPGFGAIFGFNSFPYLGKYFPNFISRLF